jgi:hypothetical protein
MVERVHKDLPFTEASTGMDNRYGTHCHGDETVLVSRNVEILRKSSRVSLTGIAASLRSVLPS